MSIAWPKSLTMGAYGAAVLISLLLAGTAAAGPNLIRNPGFEEGESPQYPGVGLYWETNDAQPHPDVDVLTTSTKHSGTYSQRLKAHSTWDLGAVRQVSNYGSVTAGKTYEIRAWIKTANVYNSAGWYVFGIWWFNNDTYLSDSKMPRQETNNYDWREISWTAVAPPGANRVAAFLSRHTDGDAWYDDVFIGEFVPGPPEIARNPASFTHELRKGDNPSSDAFTVQNTGGGTLDYSITDNVGWLSVAPDHGTSTGEADTITIGYSVAALDVGTHGATITITDPAAANSPQTIAVTVAIRTPGDLDNDGDVDQEDFGRFQVCYTAPGVAQDNPACAYARLDGDVDVDLDDFAVFQNCISGPGVPGEPACAGTE